MSKMTPSERTAAWKKAHPERAKEHNRRSVAKWKRAHPERAKNYSPADYGLTIDEYHALVLAQLGECVICGASPRLVIDHDHVTGRVRGLLCRKCNLGIGLLGDDPEIVARAARYLAEPVP